jgi:phage gp46-like protein
MTGDIGLFWQVASGAADFEIEGNDLSVDGGLETAVMLSLFADRRAEDGDVLPDGGSDRRGWWADEFSTVDGDRIGSRLWLLARSKDMSEVLALAPEYAREALAWMVEDKLAEAVEVTAERVLRSGRDSAIVLNVSIQRPKADVVLYRYTYAWKNQEVRRG